MGAPVAGVLEVGLVCSGDELLQGAQLVGLGVRVHQLAVHLAVLDLLAHHEQELDQLLVCVGLRRLGDDLNMPAGPPEQGVVIMQQSRSRQGTQSTQCIPGANR